MKKITRFFIILLVIAVCFAFLWPSIAWYGMTPKEDKALATSSLERIKDYSRIKASNDVEYLQSLVEQDGTAQIPEEYSFIVKVAKKNAKLYKKSLPAHPNLAQALRAFDNGNEMISALEAEYRNSILADRKHYNNSVKLGLDLSGGLNVIVKADLDAVVASQENLTSEEIKTLKEDAMTQAVETLSSRIDKFGLSNPVIRRQGDDRIYIEIPGAVQSDSISSIIMGKGILNFRLVDMQATAAFEQYYAQNPARTFAADGSLLNPSIVPDDCEIIGLYTKDDYGLDERIGYLAVKKDVALEGKHVKSVEVGTDQYSGRPQVNFTLDSEGSDIFAAFTTEHTGDQMAIISDNKVKSYAKINEPITGGRVAINGFGLEEAQNLKKVLQTAWLSVPLSIESQQIIGASMGAQAIREGLFAIIGGLVAIMIFMLIFYKGAGVNAVVAQILNMYFIFSILSAFNLTLTLSSIAGMILTIGMAVDANVIVFERIKEERRLGKSREACIAAGFDRALGAVMDGNITTFIAAIFLSQLGTGSIQGFAVSLSIGVVSSVFTALFVSRLMFDFGTEVRHAEKISIGWRIK
ncbi:MAG: protein translocase subunit SecD [Treponemataceae bacterium]|nr:protein translocase subunit SecD [Treponemataceae bacterium]